MMNDSAPPPDDAGAQELRQALLASEPLCRCLFEAAGDGILVLQADSASLVLANPALVRMLGYTPDEVTALSLQQLCPTAAQPVLRELLAAAAQGAQGRSNLTLRRKDGSEFNAAVHTRSLQLQGSTFIVAVLHDLSVAERAAAAAEQARRDSLTTLYNHRAFQELLVLELARAQRHGTPVSLLMLDIDHFKQINDTLGHQAGDAVLRQLASLLQDSARNIDQVCRYGGEEFMLILPMTSTSEALHAAERLRTLVSEQEFACSPGVYRRLTVSAGVASYPLHAQTQAALIACADAAMYAAKQAGRNRSCVFDSVAAPSP